MNGVTTAIVAFIFVCLAIPTLVKNRQQWYAALGIVIAIILIDSLAHIVGSPSFGILCYSLTGLFQAVDILVLVLACGGLTVKEMAGEFGQAYEVMRRGGTTKEVVIPLSPDAYRQAEQRYAPRPPSTQPSGVDDGAPVATPPVTPPAATARPSSSDPIPLE